MRTSKRCAVLTLLAWVALASARLASAATDWSTQDYDLYPGDFNGDGKTDILYIAKDPSKVSGIALSDGTGPNIPWQSWQSNFLGIAWYGNHYNVIVADFNGDGKADIFLQAKTPGDNYLILTGSNGHITAISQTVNNNAMGLTWSADQHRIIAGDFNGDHHADLFLQATTPAGIDAVVTSDQNGQFTAASPAQTWSDNYLGFKWSTEGAIVYAGDFNGDGRTDLLVQAKPNFVTIDFDVAFPVPTYPPNMNGIVLAQATSPIFTLAGVQAWSRNTDGVDWSTLSSTLIIGDFNGDGRADVIVQPINAAATTGTPTLLTGNASGAVLSASGTPLSGNVSLSGTRLIAASFTGHATGLYVQTSDPNGSNYVIDSVGGGFTAAVQNPSLGMGVQTATAVGRTAGQFSVGTTGGATYNIPIWTPPGARGIEPHLSLHYTSGGPDGVMGPGWALSGISTIARCNKTWAADGSPAGVTLAATDDLCLDGNRLRTTTGFTPACSGGATYQTEVADFSNVTACGSTSGTGPSYFIVQGKDGRTYQYGNGGNSQVFATSTTTPYAWGLNEILDRQGNNLTITYTPSSTTLAPQTILYTQTPATGSTYPYKVAFNYAGRAGGTTTTKYVAGGAVAQSNELLNIAVSYSGTLVRQYNLSYAVSPTTLRPLLSTVQECAGSTGADCLQPTNIKYQPGGSGWSSTPTATGLTGQYGFIPIDLNGDGIPDALYGKVSGSSIHWYARIASVFGYGAEIDTGANTSGLGPITGTFSGTAQTQFLAPVNNTWYVYTYNASSSTFSNASTGVTVGGEQFTLDWDGDGLPDLVATDGTSTVTVRRNITSPGGAVAFSTSPYTVFTGTVAQQLNVTAPLVPADFDGDGRSDLLVRVIRVNTGKGFTAFTDFAVLSRGFSAAPVQTSLGALDSNDTIGSSTIVMGDWNGDGCTDFATQTNVYISNCAGTFTSTPTGIPLFSTQPFPYPLMVADVDGDGQSDLIYKDPSTNSWYVARSLGTSLAPGTPLGIAAPTTQSFSVVDRNSDGQPDLLYIDSANGYAVSYYPHNGINTPPDLATSISDGYGMTFSPTYVPITQSNYVAGSGAVFPSVDFRGPMYVVSQFTAPDGLGSTYYTLFVYTAARLNLQGRGFLGFTTTLAQDTRNHIYHQTTYRQDFPFIGAVTEDDYLQQDLTPVNKTANTYTQTTLDGTTNNQRVFGYLSGSTVTRFEVGGAKDGQAISHTVTSYAEDSYGNITNTTSTTTDTDAAVGSAPASPFVNQQWTATITNTITNDTSSNWCIGRPSTTTTQKTAPGEPAVTRTVNHTIDYANCRATVEIVEPNDNRLKATTQFQFDGCGNTNSVSIVGLDQNGNALPARTTTTSYGTACELPESVTNALSQTATTTYNYSFGVPAVATDLNTLPTNWTYDDFGRKTLETRPDGTSTTWTYSDCVSASCWGTANLRFLVTESILDSNHTLLRTTEKFYDGLDRLNFEEGNRVLGTWTTHAILYNSLGQKYQEYVPYSVASNGYHQYTYDVAGRLTNDTLFDSGGNTYRSIGVQYFGQTVTVTDPLGNMTSKVTDVAGLLRRIIDPPATANCPSGYSLCGTTQYDYDSWGNLVAVTDPIGVRSTFTYNVRGFKTAAANADTGTWTFAPDSLNEVVTQTDALSHVTTYGYDLLGRVTSRQEPESTTPIQFTFGNSVSARNVGRLQSVTKPDGYSEGFVYDSLSRPASATYTEDGTSYVFGYAYNASGVLDTLTYPTSTGSAPFALKYRYDAYGYLNQLQDANTGASFWVLLGANDNSAPTSEILGNGVQIATGYTPWTNEMTSRTEGSGGQSANLENLNYTWDKNGNLSQRQDMIQSLTETFTPDALNRLATTSLNGTQTLSLTYDAAGDILTKSDVGSYTYGNSAHPHAVTAAGSWSIGYDANGNMNSRAGGSITSTSYNLPSQINYNGNTDQFSYNSNHQRWKQVANYGGTTETTHYIGGLLEVMTRGSVTEYRHQIPAGSSGAVYTRRTDGTSSTYYATTDHLGSSDLVLDSSANVLAHESFTPFGARRGSNWQGIPTSNDYSAFASTTRRGFTGHEMLDAVSLVHMNGRVYDPYLGRFLSADTVIQSLGASQSINPYSYAWNDPLKYLDPSGHSLIGDIVGLLVGIVIAIWLPELAPEYFGAIGTPTGVLTAITAGFVGGFVGAAISTGNLSAAFQAGVISAITAGFTAGIGVAGVQNNWDYGELAIGYSAVGCLSAVMSEGNCGKGALTAAFAFAAQPMIIKFPSFGMWGAIPETVEAGLIGGEAARISGGNFDDGFSTAAIQYLSTFKPSSAQQTGSPGHQLGRVLEGLVVDVYAAVVGQVGIVWGFIDDLGKMGNALFSGNFEQLGFDLGKTLYDLVLPHYGYYGGAGWGREQFPTGDPGPLNQQDYAAETHDFACYYDTHCTAQDNAGWIRNSYNVNQNYIPAGPLGDLYKLIGTVPFEIASKPWQNH